MLKNFRTTLLVSAGFAGAFSLLLGAAPGNFVNPQNTASNVPFQAAHGPSYLLSALETDTFLQTHSENEDFFISYLANPGVYDPEARVSFHKRLTLKRRSTLMETLVNGGIERRQAYYAIEALSETADPRKLQVGQEILVRFEKGVLEAGDKTLVEFLMPMEFGENVVVRLEEDGQYYALTEKTPTTPIRMFAEGEIQDSLYLSAIDQGVPLPVIAEMIRLFSFDVDFQREIWSGDKFSLFYERRLGHDGEAENNGRVLAASLELHNRTLTFYRFEDGSGDYDFYTADGKSARKMLMKTPVDGARLSSHFGQRRHPVLGYTRMHKGVDFAAPRGTPIMAAGDGVVERASRWGSFGNYVRIRHNGTYQTAYAHLNAYGRGIQAGVRVKQGQIIGYVGATGRVTGAHLHYEIHMNGSQINPLTLKLPKGKSLPSEEMPAFQNQTALYDFQRDAIVAFYREDGPERVALKTLVFPTTANK